MSIKALDLAGGQENYHYMLDFLLSLHLDQEIACFLPVNIEH